MFEFVKNIFHQEHHHKDAGPTEFNLEETHRMTLDERKVWREEMLRKSVRETFASIEIISSMYRFKVASVDDRGHYYAVMVETTKFFEIGKRATTKTLMDVEELLKKTTYDKYGVVVVGIYWRANDKITVFEPHTPHPLHRRTVISTQSIEPRAIGDSRRKSFEELSNSFSDTKPMNLVGNEDEPISSIPPTQPMEYVEKRTIPRPKFEPILESEERAFREAIAAGIRPPAVRIGEKEYLSDIAPLGLE